MGNPTKVWATPLTRGTPMTGSVEMFRTDDTRAWARRHSRPTHPLRPRSLTRRLHIDLLRISSSYSPAGPQRL
ncbi:hypothetical protein GCM10022420_039760 [Streptomyces iranensis]